MYTKILTRCERGGSNVCRESDVTLAKNGDKDAFVRLLEAYAPLISSLSSQFYSDDTSANVGMDDLMQEASIAFYNAVLSYTEGKNTTFGLYAKICIRNRLVSYMRRMCAGIDVKTEDIEKLIDSSVAPQADGPLELLISEEEVKTMQENIRSVLTDYEYSVFSLFVQGTAVSEIASELNAGEKSVHNAISRVRSKLKKMY